MSRRLGRRSPVIVVVMVAALGSCGSDDTVAQGRPTTTEAPTHEPGAPAEAELPSACDLVEDAEVEALIGPAEPELIEGRAIDGVEYSQCFWDGEDGVTMVGVTVVDTRARYDLHVQSSMNPEPVDGLGDEALMAPGVSSETRGATGGRTVSMRFGEQTLMVSVRLDDQTLPENVLPLAELVAARFG
jgi:hypothetical protein